MKIKQAQLELELQDVLYVFDTEKEVVYAVEVDEHTLETLELLEDLKLKSNTLKFYGQGQYHKVPNTSYVIFYNAEYTNMYIERFEQEQEKRKEMRALAKANAQQLLLEKYKAELESMSKALFEEYTN